MAMGYVRNKIYKLIFADEQFDGLEVRASSPPIGVLLEINEVRMTPVNSLSEDRAQVSKMIDIFADYLVSWNLEDADGNPIPTDVGGLWTQDREIVVAVVAAWVNAISGVSRPLEQPSPGGDPSLAASIPMEALSTSLAS